MTGPLGLSSVVMRLRNITITTGVTFSIGAYECDSGEQVISGGVNGVPQDWVVTSSIPSGGFAIAVGDPVTAWSIGMRGPTLGAAFSTFAVLACVAVSV